MDEVGDILQVFAEWWNPKNHITQSVDEILAELASRHQIGQGAVGRRDDAEIYPLRAVGADAFYLSLLEGSQNLCLGLEREIPNLIEKNIAAIGELELPRSRGLGVRVGALFNSEKFRLHQSCRNRWHIHHDEWPMGVFLLLVEQARDNFLAGTAFAENENIEMNVVLQQLYLFDHDLSSCRSSR